MENQELIEKLVSVQEGERQRIAADLHDTSLQVLAYLTGQIELASMYIDVDVNQSKLILENVNNSLKSVIEDIRNTIYDLRPMSFDDLGLKEALENSIRDLNSKSEINYIYNICDIDIESIPYKLCIYRIIMECLNNCEKHSNANKVIIDFIKDKNYFIHIKDNGFGFDMEKFSVDKVNHFGLKLIKERVKMMGGDFIIESALTEGTDVKIYIPSDI